MRPGTAWLLAGGTSPHDLARARLVVGASAVSGSLLLGAARIARLRGDHYGWSGGSGGSRGDQQLAGYVAEAALRPGVVIGAVLLVVPVLVLAVQALRLGSSSRDRRSAALRLAGATPVQTRWFAALDTARAAAAGGALAGPGYLLLSLLLGPALPARLRMLPSPDGWDSAAWLGVVLGLAAAGGLAGAGVSRAVVVDPLGQRFRVRPVTHTRNRAVVALVFAAAVVCLPWAVAARSPIAQFSLVAGTLVLLVAAGFTAGPVQALAAAARCERVGDAVHLLAASRIRADPAGPGRVATVLAFCGLAFGVEASQAGSVVGSGLQQDLDFYLFGYATAAAATLLAVAAATATMAVAAFEHLLDAPRPLAALAALGVDLATLRRALRVQLCAVAVPATTAGAAVGTLLSRALTSDGTAEALVAGVVTTVASGAAASGLVRLVVRALDRHLREATDVTNLRTA